MRLGSKPGDRRIGGKCYHFFQTLIAEHANAECEWVRE